MTIAEKLLPEFDEEFAKTRSFLELVPDDKMLWKPHRKSMELGRLAWHLAEFPEWVVMTFTQESIAITQADAEKAANGWKGLKRSIWEKPARLSRLQATRKWSSTGRCGGRDIQ